MIRPICPKIYSYSYPKVAFKAHPDFDELSKDYEIKASSYFRRGFFYGSPSDKYQDIVNVFQDVFANDTKAKTMLIGGIGDSQEPFSYLATIKQIIKDRKLKDALDLRIVDLQSKPKTKDLFENSFFDHSWEPAYARSSFVIDKDNYERFDTCYYRVNDEIFNFLKMTYNDSYKSHWDTRIQEDIKNYPTESFDIISMNNTLPYIRDQEKIDETLRHIYRILKPNGIFITDPCLYSNMEMSNVTKNCIEIAEGIYKKTDKLSTADIKNY